MSNQNDTITELVIFSSHYRGSLSSSKNGSYSQEVNSDVSPNLAQFNYLVNLHKSLASNRYATSISIPYNPNVYPGDTIKYLWNNITKGGMVLTVDHAIDIMPQDNITGTTSITYSAYKPEMMTKDIQSTFQRHTPDSEG